VPFAIDETRRRLYGYYTQPGPSTHIVEYDLRQTIPRMMRDVVLPIADLPSTNGIAFDPARHRAFLVDNEPLAAGSTCPCSYISILDLETLTLQSHVWNLTLELPNLNVAGISYSAADDRLYVVGSLAGYVANFAPTFVPPALPTAVAAVDARTGNIAWSRPLVPQCQMPSIALGTGAPIFRSARLNALYIPCVRPDAPGHAAPYPGESGLVRIWITPQATQSEAQGFATEFFPVSGTYTDVTGLSGRAVFDNKSERLYLLSSSASTPGAWVFDGLLPAWVGFVAANDEENVDMGLDPATGHLYLRGDDHGTFIVSDGRSTPVPQGLTFHFPSAYNAPNWPVDSLTHRLFVPYVPPPSTTRQIQVLRDDTPVVPPPKDVAYDSLTTNVPEGPNTIAAFSGDASGYGTRATLVGGYGGIADPVVGLDLGGLANDVPVSGGAGLSPGGRGLTIANVASVDLRNVGAGASAQAVAPDMNTVNDYTTEQTAIADQGNSVQNGVGDTVAGQLDWKWPAATCLDGGGDTLDQTQTGPAATSHVTCDLSKDSATASSAFGSLGVDGLTIASASFTTTVEKDPAKGTLSTATAIARGLEVSVPGAGTLTIGSITSTATTEAHGRPGTAHASWTSVLDNVVLKDASGKVLFRCPSQCDPHVVAQQVNDSELAVKMRILIPAADVRSTPGGAYAGVQRSDPDYWSGLTLNDDNSRAVPAMQIELYNDYGQKSRLVVQVAAVQLNSIYGISVLPTFVQPPTSNGPLPGATQGHLPVTQPNTGNGAGGGTGAGGGGGLIRRIEHGAGFLVRSPRDAALFALVCALFSGAVLTVRRRQALVAQLERLS